MSKNPVFDGISSVWLLTVKTNQNSHEKSGKWYGIKIMTSLAQFKTSCSWTLTFVVDNLNSDSRNKETLFLLPDFRNVEVSCFFKSLNSRQTQITSLSLIFSWSYRMSNIFSDMLSMMAMFSSFLATENWQTVKM